MRRRERERVIDRERVRERERVTEREGCGVVLNIIIL
jgi:hypothetical protein